VRVRGVESGKVVRHDALRFDRGIQASGALRRGADIPDRDIKLDQASRAFGIGEVWAGAK
jgi:hypothetical protein